MPVPSPTARPPVASKRVQSRAGSRSEDPRARFEHARRVLMRADPALGAIIKRVGRLRPDFEPRDPFGALVRALVSQQLSTKAADTIHGRVCRLVPRVSAKHLLKVSPEQLRAAGLSRPKIGYLRDLSERVADGRLDLASLRHKPDEDVIDAIVTVKGFGRWSGQMFLMFCLHRPDVLPTGDLGIVKGMQGILGMKRRPAERTMERAAKAWQPYRSIACWYVWRSLE